MHAVPCCKPLRDLKWYHVYLACNGRFNSATHIKRQGIPLEGSMAPEPH